MNTTVAKRIKFQSEAKAKYEDNPIILFRDCDFYFMYNEDADTLSKEIGVTRVLSMDGDFRYAVIPARTLDKHLPGIIRNGHRVAICDGIF